MQIKVLTKQHDRKLFDCGTPELNRFLSRNARQADERSLSRTYVLTFNHDNTIMGFYTLSSTEIHAPSNSKLKNYPLPVPAIKLARLAIDKNHQGQGYGAALLSNALKKVNNAHQSIPTIGLVVDAKTEAAKSFYQQFGFIEMHKEEETLQLWLPIKTISQLFLKTKT
ncbi:MAG: GNAT family N-acetyltransferase [Pseudomonadales bacterium]|nr:GNAT family N-acetyltransferase [Pseudomonadales bacterium]